MTGLLLAALFAVATTLPTPGATPSLSALPTPSPTAEAAPGVSCVMAADVANCTAINLIYPRQIAVDGTFIGTVAFNGPFTITFQAGSGSHRIYIENLPGITVVAP